MLKFPMTIAISISARKSKAGHILSSSWASKYHEVKNMKTKEKKLHKFYLLSYPPQCFICIVNWNSYKLHHTNLNNGYYSIPTMINNFFIPCRYYTNIAGVIFFGMNTSHYTIVSCSASYTIWPRRQWH